MQKGLIIAAIIALFLLGAAAFIGIQLIGAPSGTATTDTRTSGTVTPAGEVAVGLETVATGLTAPIALAAPADGSGRLFIADQTGTIRIIENGTLQDEPFLDIRGRMVDLNPGYDERGLLGMALHPNFTENGKFFVYYSAPLAEGAPDGWDHTSHLAEFSAAEGDPDTADPGSERILLRVDQPQANHNGGQITFGPDGYLYVPLGDGGGAGDTGPGHPPPGNGQNTSTVLGSILRIDVNGGDPYAVPASNPFADGTSGRPEIFAYGFRNPFRIAFDAGGEQSLFVGDVGQNRWEEVNIARAGENYGWNIKEGTHCFDPQNPGAPAAGCPETGSRGEMLTGPIIEYPNAGQPDGIGQAVIGGYVYRGSSIPALQGQYVFGDWSTGDGTLFAAVPAEGGNATTPWSMSELAVAGTGAGGVGAYILSFGQDAENELYVLTSENAGPTGTTGTVYRLVPTGG